MHTKRNLADSAPQGDARCSFSWWLVNNVICNGYVQLIDKSIPSLLFSPPSHPRPGAGECILWAGWLLLELSVQRCFLASGWNFWNFDFWDFIFIFQYCFGKITKKRRVWFFLLLAKRFGKITSDKKFLKPLVNKLYATQSFEFLWIYLHFLPPGFPESTRRGGGKFKQRNSNGIVIQM